MKETRIATRYAKSLLDLCLEKNTLDQVVKDFKSLQQVISQNREFRNLLESPVVKADKKTAILTEVFGSTFNPVSMGFLVLLTKKNREAATESIVHEFLHLNDLHKGVQKVTVTTATGLDDKLRKQVMELVKKSSGGEIELVEKQDPAIIGGFVLRMDDKQIDSSVVKHLTTLKKQLKN